MVGVGRLGSALSTQLVKAGWPVTVRLYRQKGANAPFLRVTELQNNASTTYDDNVADPLSGIVPLAQNRTDLTGSGGGGITGYFEYAPGNSIPDSATNGSYAQGAAPAFDGKGWIVDAPGCVSFAAGAWSVKVKLASMGSALSTGCRVASAWASIQDSRCSSATTTSASTCTGPPGSAPRRTVARSSSRRRHAILPTSRRATSASIGSRT